MIWKISDWTGEQANCGEKNVHHEQNQAYKKQAVLYCILWAYEKEKKTPWAGSVRATAARRRTVRRAIFIER